MDDAFQILVVDDESALREICQEALADDGYNVDVAGNGREALGKLIGKEYDLVISDLRMPDMNGQELLTAIRQRSLDVDFLVMTGFGTTETAVELMRGGAVDYISKPFDIKQMLLRVHAVLDRRVIRRKQEKLSAVVRMLNLSKGLASQLDHIAVVDEFLCHLSENFHPDSICLLLPDLPDQNPNIVRGNLLRLNEKLNLFVTRLCREIMASGRSHLLDRFTMHDSSFDPSLFPGGFNYSVMALPLDLPQKRIGVIALVRDGSEVLYRAEDLQLLGVFASHTASALENARLYSRLHAMNHEMIRSFSHAVEVKDLYTKGHSERVAAYACRLGRALQLDSGELEKLYVAGILHDIGKIGIPDRILNKPGALGVEEFEIMKRHAFMGREILGQIESMGEVASIVFHHHERMDGQGYPEGLSGDAVPFLSRIISLADSYEAMTSSRSYRRALPMEKVVRILQNGAGSQWDRELTGIWLDIMERERPGFSEAS